MYEGQITLRDAVPEDLPFLARLYSDTRRQEVAPWGWPPEQQEMFLRMQFDAQRASYRSVYPGATDRIVCLENTAVGRMLVNEDAAGMRLVDIALLAEQRNRGIGTELLCGLLRECETQGRILCLQVLQGNPAIRLYQRLGLRQSGGDSMYAQMEWTPLPVTERS